MINIKRAERQQACSGEHIPLRATQLTSSREEILDHRPVHLARTKERLLEAGLLAFGSSSYLAFPNPCRIQWREEAKLTDHSCEGSSGWVTQCHFPNSLLSPARGTLSIDVAIALQQSAQVPIDHALILGGARSGKSRFAERLACSRSLRLVYVATAEAHDDEMADRIARHRIDRGPDWQTIESPINLPATITAISRMDTVVVVDCLTLWLSNIMMADRNVTQATDDLRAALAVAPGVVVMVANEVGLGIVPDNALARQFRDEAGRMNQLMAAQVPHVAFISAGLPIWLKGKLG